MRMVSQARPKHRRKAYHILVENANIHSWRKLNLSKILIDVIEYSSNGRG